ncbi:MAG: hypothetical protein JWO53_241, partial [Chlamydiia bacterium]|nr:hypothetical protein [Chlamydiia bacterium]
MSVASMVLRSLFFLILFCLFSYECQAKIPKNPPIEFVIVIPSYNNEKWVIKNLESVVCQTYPHWSIYYINDCSQDSTGAILDQFILSKGIGNKCTVIHNKERRGALANLYTAIHNIDEKKIIVDLDGDDRLSNPYVLEYLASIYGKRTVNHPRATWLTYGSFQSDPSGYPNCSSPFPPHVLKKRTFRSHPWRSSHLKTFYAKLFHLVKREDLLWNGIFFPMTSDLAIMFPMLEMASQGHIRFVKKIVHIYNISSPLQDHKVNSQLQRKLEATIREQKPYN